MKISIKGMGRLGLLTMLLAFVLPLTAPLAQNAAAPAADAPAAPPKPAKKEQSLWDVVISGGIFMIPLGMVSVAALTVTIRNVLVLKRDKLMRPDLIPPLRQMAAEANIHGMNELCAANPCFLTGVLRGGLERVTGDELNVDSVKEGMELTGKYLTTSTIKWVNWLSNFAAIAPMLGLLGTVQGMIGAFQKISLGQMGQGEAMAADIQVALITTAAGLVIAIPTMLSYYFFKASLGESLGLLSSEIALIVEAMKTGRAGGETETQPA